MNYDFSSPAKIIFGWGRLDELPRLAAGLGNRVFLISGSATLECLGVMAKVRDQLSRLAVESHLFRAANHEPNVADVDTLVASLLQRVPTERDVVVAIGGGSAIDLAKAAAALVTNRHGTSVVEFLEGVGSGLQITNRPLTLIAVPTTSGTGAEATKNAVISSETPAFKKSLRSDLMMPKVVLVDPELTVSLPAQITAYTGMDAVTQLIESYVSRRATTMTKSLAIAGLKLAIPALPVVVRDGTSREHREAMSHAALVSGLALANSGLGLAHGVAAALGVHCRVPHGLACAVMLPTAMRVNQQVSERQFAELERLFDRSHANDADSATAFVRRIEALCQTIGIPARLRDLGVKEDQFPALIASSRGNSMNGNPRDVTDGELQEIFDRIW